MQEMPVCAETWARIAFCAKRHVRGQAIEMHELETELMLRHFPKQTRLFHVVFSSGSLPSERRFNQHYLVFYLHGKLVFISCNAVLDGSITAEQAWGIMSSGNDN